MTTLVYVGLTSTLAALGWTLWIGLRRRDAAVVANALASLGTVALPTTVEFLAAVFFGLEFSFGPLLPLCIAVAGVLHMLGMLGWYDRRWWWDHVTHAASAALVAAVVYAWVLVAGTDALPGPLAALSAPVATLVLTMASGVFWELLEWAARLVSDRLGIERVLKHYGRFDTPLDLLFDFLGAALVVALDARLFVPAFEPIPGPTRTLLHGWLVVLAVGSAVAAAIVGYGRRAW